LRPCPSERLKTGIMKKPLATEAEALNRLAGEAGSQAKR
jgi:hypothetical protein